MSNARKLADNLPSEGQLSGRNVVVNGAMNLSQRQTSSSNVGNKYVLDRFYVYKQNTGSTYTCSQNSVTDLAGFANSLKMDCTTADTSTASNEEVYIQTKLEGQDVQRFQKGHATALGFTLSFYVKTNKAGVYTVKMFDRDNSRDVSGSYTVADANWNRYTINFPADTTGKFDDDNASSLEIFFSLVRGSDTTGGTLNTAWRANSDASSASGQVNFADSTSNDWEITGIQLETGSGAATPFEHRSFGDELLRCQRYFQRLTGDEGGGNDGGFMNGAIWNSTDFYGSVHHITSMRAEPTLSFSAIGDLLVFAGGVADTPSSFTKTGGTSSYTEINIGGLGNTAGRGAWVRIDGGPSNFADFDSEL